MPCVLRRVLRGDGALIDLASHWQSAFLGGRPFAADFSAPVHFTVDVDLPGRRMPTLFTTPALVAQARFADLLTAAGVDNVDAYPATIRDPSSGATFDGYRVLNIVGLIACADLEANPGVQLGPGVRVIDAPVLRGAALHGAHIFRLAEDPVQIIVADALARRIQVQGFEDVDLTPLRVT